MTSVDVSEMNLLSWLDRLDRWLERTCLFYELSYVIPLIAWKAEGLDLFRSNAAMRSRSIALVR